MSRGICPNSCAFGWRTASSVTIREDVERFLDGGSRHKLPSKSSWKSGNREGELRMRLPIEVDGEIGGFELDLVKAPDSDDPGLRIILMYGRAFWRLCMGDVEHPNSINRPDDLPALIVGPHYHCWADNRRFGEAASLPKRLRNARILPQGIVGDADAFAWFLSQVNIVFPDWEMPSWPTRTLLL